jgi:hypothetical protein
LDVRVAARAFHALLQIRLAAKAFFRAAQFPKRRAAASGVIDPQKACPRRDRGWIDFPKGLAHRAGNHPERGPSGPRPTQRSVNVA